MCSPAPLCPAPRVSPPPLPMLPAPRLVQEAPRCILRMLHGVPQALSSQDHPPPKTLPEPLEAATNHPMAHHWRREFGVSTPPVTPCPPQPPEALGGCCSLCLPAPPWFIWQTFPPLVPKPLTLQTGPCLLGHLWEQGPPCPPQTCCLLMRAVLPRPLTAVKSPGASQLLER